MRDSDFKVLMALVILAALFPIWGIAYTACLLSPVVGP